jgi:hypothetical protein
MNPAGKSLRLTFVLLFSLLFQFQAQPQSRPEVQPRPLRLLLATARKAAGTEICNPGGYRHRRARAVRSGAKADGYARHLPVRVRNHAR